MPRILAIDWDRREARALVVQSGPTGTSVVGAWTASLETADSVATTGKQTGARLAAAMAGHQLGKVTTIVGVGRDNVQMKLLSLPPAPADEMPDLIRFQAEREFTALGDDAALDYIPLSSDASGLQQVLAVALGPIGLAEAREVCEAFDVEPDRLPLRACATASLVNRSGVVDGKSVALVVNPLTDEADLTVLSGDQVVLMRTVRLPDASQSAARQRALVGEIRRTSAAIRQQLTDRQVDQILLCGNAAASDQAAALSEELGAPIDMFDPLAYAPAGLDRQGVPAESLARFAAVLGMALSEADRRPPIIDFLNIRRGVVVRRFTRLHALAAGAAAVAMLGVGVYMWRQSTAPTRELERVNAELRGLELSLVQYEKVIAEAAAIEGWLQTDVTWLDELEWFSRQVRPEPLASKDFPVSNDVVVKHLIMLRPPGADPMGGRITVQEAVAKSDMAVTLLEARLRDGMHVVSAAGVRPDSGTPGYGRAFAGMTINVTSPDPGIAAPVAEVVAEAASPSTPIEKTVDSAAEDATSDDKEVDESTDPDSADSDAAAGAQSSESDEETEPADGETPPEAGTENEPDEAAAAGAAAEEVAP